MSHAYSVDEEKIRSVISDAQRRKIAEFCIEPHSSDEIYKKLLTVWGNYKEETLASDIKAMEDNKSLVYSEEKWKTTEPTKKVLRKYFGFR